MKERFLMEKIIITENIDEMISIGKHIFETNPDIYNKRVQDILWHEINNYLSRTKNSF